VTVIVLIEVIVIIIQVRKVASRARRGATTNMIIQGGMAFRLMGLRSRLEERHEERKEKEREERARRPEVEKRKNRGWSTHSAPFSRSVNGRRCLWVREDLHNEQTGMFLVNSHVATVVGKQRSRWQPQHNEGSRGGAQNK